MASRYAAFLSYSHTADGELAPLVQRGLQRLARPWYRRPTVKIFRDETSLAANPGLWTSIEKNLAESDYLILLAAPDAAESAWVAKEIQWWREHRDAETLLIVVTDGKIAWDAQSVDFDWQGTNCLPPSLKGFAREEPLHVDLRWAKRRQLPHLRDPRVREALLMLLAAITGRPKDELDSEDIRQARRFKFAAIATGVLVAVLAVGAVYGTWNAARNRVEADRNYRQSESRRLAAASLEEMDQNRSIDRAITLAVLAWQLTHTPEAESALQRLQRTTSDVARIFGRQTSEIKHLEFSGDSSVLATAAEDGSIALWRVADWSQTRIVLPGELDSRRLERLERLKLDRTGAHVLVRGYVRNVDEDRMESQSSLMGCGIKNLPGVADQNLDIRP